MSVTLFEHPDYSELAKHWTVYRDLYEGKHDILIAPQYLWYHQQELISDPDGYSAQIRRVRAERTRYLNIPEIIVSLWTSYFFKEEPMLDDATTELLAEDDAEDNIDGKGTSLFGFIKDGILKNYLIYGKPIVLVDAFPGEVRSEGERRNLGLRPYMELLNPIAVMDWSFEENDPKRLGLLNMLRHEYQIIRPRFQSTKPETVRYSDTLSVEGGKYTVYRDMMGSDENQSLVKSSDGTVWEREDVIETGLTEIPVSMIEAESWIKDVCQETLRVYNLRSSKDNIEYYQAYQKIFVTGVTTQEQQKALSENIVALLPAGATWGSIEPVDTSSLERSIQQGIDNAFKVGLNLGRQLPADSRAGQSEGAQSEEKTNSYMLVESALDDIETLVNDCMEDYAAFKGRSDWEGHIELSRDIGEKNFDEFIQLWQSFSDALRGSEIVKRAALQKVIERLKLPIESDDLQLAIEQAAGASEPKPAEGNLLQGFLTGGE